MEEERNKVINIAGRDFEIKTNFRKSCKLSKFRNKMRYSGIDVTEENKEYLLEIEKLRKETKDGEEPDISRLSTPALKILQQMSDKNVDVFNDEELLEIGQVLLEIEDKNEVEQLYEEELQEEGYDELISKILYGLAMVFMNAKDGLVEEKKSVEIVKTTEAVEVAQQ